MPEELLLFASRRASRTGLAWYLDPETRVIRYAAQRSGCAESGRSSRKINRLIFMSRCP